MRTKIIAPACIAALALIAIPLLAQQANTSPILRNVGITQRLNEQIPPDIVLRDESGKAVRLGDYFGKKPIVLTLVYFGCPALCPMVLGGELQTMKAMSLNLGKDYDAVTVSFDPTDTPAEATAKREVYAGQYGRPGAMENWHFLTGEQPSIDALTEAAGFHYVYDAANRQYAHVAAIMVLTPEGRVARYFYGVEYAARDLRLGLVEASEGKIGTATDQVLLYCYHYDPTTGKYGLVVMNVVRAGGALTVLVLGIFMLLMFRRERKHPKAPVAGV